MTTFCSKQGTANQTRLLPKWVIEHLIKLSEHAGIAGFSTFEEKLVEATESLLEELNEKVVVPDNLYGLSSMANDNIIVFRITDHHLKGKPC